MENPFDLVNFIIPLCWLLSWAIVSTIIIYIVKRKK